MGNPLIFPAVCIMNHYEHCCGLWLFSLAWSSWLSAAVSSQCQLKFSFPSCLDPHVCSTWPLSTYPLNYFCSVLSFCSLRFYKVNFHTVVCCQMLFLMEQIMAYSLKVLTCINHHISSPYLKVPVKLKR